MIRDIVFYPAAALFAALLIVLALSPAFGALPSGPVSVGDGNYQRVTVGGTQLNRMQPGGNADLTLIGRSSNSTMRIDIQADTLSDDPVVGPHFPLAADLELQFAGFEVTVTVRAKPGPERGATQMRLNYSTGRNGESGWQVFDLRPDFADYSFTYKVPPKTGEQGLDYLGIRPVVPDKSRSLVLERVTIDRGTRWTE